MYRKIAHVRSGRHRRAHVGPWLQVMRLGLVRVLVVLLWMMLYLRVRRCLRMVLLVGVRLRRLSLLVMLLLIKATHAG